MAKRKKVGDQAENTAKPGEPLLDQEARKRIEEETAFNEAEVYKSDINAFVGELDIDLDREMSDGQTLREKLSSELASWLTKELENHEQLIENLQKWDKQYRGIKPEKSYPYPGAHNTAIPMTRILTDAVVVRIFDVIWGQKKIATCNARKPEYVDAARRLEDAIDWWQKDVINLKSKLFPVIMQAVKTGASFCKISYSQKNRTIYRYASIEEVNQKVPALFKFKNGQWGIKKVETSYRGPDILPISREDFVYSSDAKSLDEAFLVGFRTYLRKPELKLRERQGIYIKGSVDKIINPDKLDETKEKRAENRDLKITDSSQRDDKTKLYEIWEIWFRYDVDEDGEEDDIVITFHRQSKTILRAKYNPLFMGFRPFVAFKFLPIEFSIEGEGTCQILEKLQLELDGIHNARLDKLDQINAPIVLIREGSGFENSLNFGPGMVKVTADELNDQNPPIKFLQFPEIYPSTWNEEKMILDYMQQATGVSPIALGQPTSERPVARETYQLIQEMNKKFKFGCDNIRDCLAELLNKAVMMMAQYQPRYEYYVPDENGIFKKEKLDFPFEFLRDAINIRLTASSELLNVETRRENNLITYQLMSDFDTKLAGMLQAMVNPQTPPEIRQFLFEVAQQGYKLVVQILEDIGNRSDADQLVPNVANMINPQTLFGQPQPQMTASMAPQVGSGGVPQPQMAGVPQDLLNKLLGSGSVGNVGPRGM